MDASISVSVVSHGHGVMVERLVEQLLACEFVCQIVVTLNIPQIVSLSPDPRIVIVQNKRPKGFGENHNAAFAISHCAFFCVINPDIELLGDPFPALIDAIAEHEAALAAPVVLSRSGAVDDSVRRFPTVGGLLKKALFGVSGAHDIAGLQPMYPEWVAGMFMLFRSEVFSQLQGFDESFFLYYEDVDICIRLWTARRKVIVVPVARVVHDARRASRHDLRHFCWHMSSCIRYLIKHAWRLPPPS